METTNFNVEYQEEPKQPIERYEIGGQEYVRVMGVELPRAENDTGEFVPKLEQYSDIVLDSAFLELLKDTAISFKLGEPMLTEGGTSIGKTTAIKYLCAHLGYEVRYANLNIGADETKLMGKPLPNVDRQSLEEPEYIYWLGKVSSGLVPEEGKVKVVLLDELGAATPENLILMHEVLDSVSRGEPLDLSEWGNGIVHVDKEKVKLVALTNPPGKGYLGRSTLDPALVRRFVYKKTHSALPKASLENYANSLVGLPTKEDVEKEDYVVSREDQLPIEVLKEIPGFADIWQRYLEFHEAARAMVSLRKIGADQPQPFTFDDREEPRRVANFVRTFYRGDINETMQAAIRFLYLNKLEPKSISVKTHRVGNIDTNAFEEKDNPDRASLVEIAKTVQYIPSQENSQRRGFDRSSTAVPERQRETVEVSQEQDAWSEALGTNVEVPPLPAKVTPEVQKNLESLGFELRYIPKLDIGTLDELQSNGQERFLDEIQRRYPNWRRYESLSSEEIADHRVGRNLEEWFWGLAKDGKMEFPQLPGTWVAVETMQKPSYGKHYDKTPVSERLGFDDRFNVSWDDAHRAIENNKRELLSEIGLPSSADVRMLEAVEWNLLANREGWGSTNTYEWTNTEARDDGGSYRVIVGFSAVGGAARAPLARPTFSHDFVGFRVAVVLGT